MAATVTYQYPVAVQGGTIAPTVAQVASLVNASVNWLDADLTAIVTHNFGLTTTQLTALMPWVTFNNDVSDAGTANPTITITKTANNITLTKVSAAGSGGTMQVFIERVNTLIG